MVTTAKVDMVKGQIQKATKREANGKNGPFTVIDVTINGVEYSAFKEYAYLENAVGKWFCIEYETKGQYRRIVTCAPMTPPDPTKTMTSPSPAPTPTATPRGNGDNREASIERQVCLKAAAEITAALVAANKIGNTDVALESMRKLYEAGVNCLTRV